MIYFKENSTLINTGLCLILFKTTKIITDTLGHKRPGMDDEVGKVDVWKDGEK